MKDSEDLHLSLTPGVQGYFGQKPCIFDSCIASRGCKACVLVPASEKRKSRQPVLHGTEPAMQALLVMRKDVQNHARQRLLRKNEAKRLQSQRPVSKNSM